MFKNRVESVNEFIENLYMLLDDSIIDEFEYGRLIGAICATRGIDCSQIVVKKYES